MLLWVCQAQQAREQAALLQQDLAAAAPALEVAAHTEAEAGAAFAGMAGPLMQEATALRAGLEAGLAAAEDTPRALRSLDLALPDLAQLASRVSE